MLSSHGVLKEWLLKPVMFLAGGLVIFYNRSRGGRAETSKVLFQVLIAGKKQNIPRVISTNIIMAYV